MPTVMIIGASRGIGLELARQYAKDGWRVHATTRTPAQPGPLGALAGDIALHALEVRDAAQITALATELLPQASVMRVAGTNHMMPLQDPDSVAGLIRNFVSQQP